MQINKALKWTALSGIFLIPFIPFLIFSDFFFPFITSKAFAFRIIVEVAFLAWAILALRDPKYRPRLTWISKSIFIFLIIIGLADLVGVAPVKSFWSNFERMEGFITLLHLALYFLVASAMLNTQSLWRGFWNTTLSASLIMVVYSAFQLAGAITINQGGVRVDGTFGNATYLAVYMLVHIFLAAYLFVMERKGSIWRIFYPISIALNLWILYFTATRGAILGLLVGIVVAAALIVFGEKGRPKVRKASIIVLGSLVVLSGLFMLVRNTEFVRESAVLGRFASISVEELKGQGRYFIWPMALKGIAERPILGWGQENFNYVFNKYYDPGMFRQEPWFDRAHNIILDWAIAGGLLGLAAYLSILVALLHTLWRKTDLSYVAKSVMTGLIAAYFFQNLFVFDNLGSYMLFFSLLAYIHVISVKPDSPDTSPRPIAPYMVTAVSILLVLVSIFTLYKWNLRPIQANTTLIDAITSLHAQAPQDTLGHFKKTISKSRLGRPEAREQMISNAGAVLSSSVPTQYKNEYYAFTREQIIAQISEARPDARYYLMAGSFLSQTGQFDEALQHLARARELSPNKQAISFEIGSVLVAQKKYKEALEEFRRAYELAPEYHEAQIIYLVGAIYAGDMDLSRDLLAQIPSDKIVGDDRVARALLDTGRLGDLVALLNERINADPGDPKHYVTLASVLLEAGEKSQAIAVLKKIGELFPTFKTQADEYIKEIESGN